ncbi:hypothetical protein BCR34DRAFT_326301 [Clohesyomyces aquaticus]|uniref:Uncharacterized protein n=1 Tax=Clohesyomyces aquaticus TaxID=1231657 RepID=A0A1Y1ZMF2_9PLEO|nr:hypothetical protein BCR34DRAFT_326301 [Clohesyomyces aquaticus]
MRSFGHEYSQRHLRGAYTSVDTFVGLGRCRRHRCCPSPRRVAFDSQHKLAMRLFSRNISGFSKVCRLSVPWLTRFLHLDFHFVCPSLSARRHRFLVLKSGILHLLLSASLLICRLRPFVRHWSSFLGHIQALSVCIHCSSSTRLPRLSLFPVHSLIIIFLFRSTLHQSLLFRSYLIISRCQISLLIANSVSFSPASHSSSSSFSFLRRFISISSFVLFSSAS